jgi:hypothetical protein
MMLGVESVDFPWVKFHEACYGEGEKTSEVKKKSIYIYIYIYI